MGYIRGVRGVFATGEERDRRAGLLAALLVVALIFCHGFFGGLHLISASSGVSADADGGFVGSAVGGHAHHLGASDSQGPGGPQDPAAHAGTSDYYAAMLVVAVGAAFVLLLGASLRNRPFLVAASLRGGFAPVPGVPVLARGPDRRALLQVFRL